MNDLKNVHPAVLKAVQAKLPANSEILAAMSVDDSSSVFMVQHNGEVKRVPMPKARVEQIFYRRPCEIEAEDGELWETIMMNFSDKYKLNLVPGVDFVVRGTESDKVSFEGEVSVRLAVTMEPDSITLYGGLTIKVLNKAIACRPKSKLVPDLKAEKMMLALTSTVLESNVGIVTGTQLTSAFSKKVAEYLASLKLPLTLSVDQLGTAKVIEDTDDGISRIVVIKTLQNRVVPIRYRVTA